MAYFLRSISGWHFFDQGVTFYCLPFEDRAHFLILLTLFFIFVGRFLKITDPFLKISVAFQYVGGFYDRTKTFQDHNFYDQADF